MEIKIGSVVRSKTGRDSNGMFAVVGIDEKYVYICDGKERPVERPKRKNPKHISATKIIIDAEEMQTNRKLKKALKNYQSI
ncbi:MAG: KOW domain-containing RNA-binding protein [Clostridia bacterium]|nr:KOW domain-containing RNA-binding protein [Clostridia bacterium]